MFWNPAYDHIFVHRPESKTPEKYLDFIEVEGVYVWEESEKALKFKLK